MISIFQLWTFHVYVAPFQQHLHNANISLRWYDISELAAPIRISLLEDVANTEATEINGSFWKRWSHHFENITVTTMTWLTVMEYLCHTDHRNVPLIVSTSRSFTHSRLIIGFVTILTQRVPLVDQDLQTLLEHLSSPRSLVGLVLPDL
jgi:hypothetical protein